MLWILFSFLSGLLSAILAIIVKIYLKNINSFFITFLFFIIASIIFLFVGIYSKKITFELFKAINYKEAIALIIAAIVNAFAFNFYLSAIGSCNKVSNVVAIDRMGILYVILFSAFFLHQGLTVKSIIGSLLMIIGVALIA